MPQVYRVDLGHRDSLPLFAKALWTGLIVLAAVLASRRMTGLFSQTLTDVAACAAASIAVVISLLAYHLHWSSSPSSRKQNPYIFVGVVTLVPSFAIGLALQPNPSTVAASYLTSLFLVACCVIFVMGNITALPSQLRTEGTVLNDPGRDETVFFPKVIPEQETRQTEDRLYSKPSMEIDRSVLQWMRRTNTDGLQERIEGGITVPFASGQKRAFVHIPFCPPLSTRPDVDCDLLDGTLIRLKVAAEYPYGTRIEVRRTGSVDDAEEIQIGFHAVATALHSKAA